MITSPFPGMDPYLEAPAIRHSLPTRLITIIADELAAKLAPDYIADLETEIIIEHIDAEPDSAKNGGANGGAYGSSTQNKKVIAIPDVAVRPPEGATPDRASWSEMAVAPLQLRIPMPVERRLTQIRIIHRASETLVAVIELLSPVNKRNGEQRQKYLRKRDMYVDSAVHLVEIDLLRQWERMPLEGELPPCDYLVIVSDARKRPAVAVWPIRLQNPLPIISIPLLPSDPSVPLDLGNALRTAYQRGRYDLQIDYSRPPVPPLAEPVATWVATLLAQRRTAQ